MNQVIIDFFANQKATPNLFFTSFTHFPNVHYKPPIFDSNPIILFPLLQLRIKISKQGQIHPIINHN